MKQNLSPTLDDIQLECVLIQAWKKTTSYLRTHSWYADTLGIDYQTLRLPQFISELQEAIASFEDWSPIPMDLVPAPKSQKWTLFDGEWRPLPKQGYQKKLRPLAHVALRDQVIAMAILLCLADRVETMMGDPRLPIDLAENRQRVLGYGHRLFCDQDHQRLRHRWGSSKLYRQYFQDYRTFLERPRVVTKGLPEDGDSEVAIVQSDLSKFYDRVDPVLLQQKIAQFHKPGDDHRFFEFAARVFDWRWSDKIRAERHAKEQELPDFSKVALPQGLVASGFFANIVLQDFEQSLRNTFGKTIDRAGNLVLNDAAYYVDDLRLVLTVPRGLTEDEIKNATVNWLQKCLTETAPGLLIEPTKTKVTVEGRDRRFLVPQSNAARRIQSEVSGTFDMLHGTELIGAIEGFFHTQQRFSSEATPNEAGMTGLLVGMSDMGDETAARFAAGKFRRTFRSLRPLLGMKNQVSAKQRRTKVKTETCHMTVGCSVTSSSQRINSMSERRYSPHCLSKNGRLILPTYAC